ncbi:CBS domain-containing protein [Pseudomonas sp. ZM23]|uniref:CBS domain-containing protein n=1 Tax=Pseudomonas triclosanedens TaxID=2961893 RepID=A0ABY7A135_9PSED|nr:CBS domain-containing protein [Pseudomonas triclosanedens]MCP8462760.1 CBS domain-containing protein [Pseudomonas triclosanedens]MCP8468380.1 CBS domain-containing protein [Pseudomonas triclosanedens]MCP8475139.1 CBS domain-containing protein [Pseudomonas triclosanedens]WAI49945.1 CBS domain-containing protein [Pseudomonas triclosanedens]
MKSVAQLLNAKPDQQVYTITPDAVVLDALRLMAEKNLGGLPVVEGNQVVGFFSERDYARRMALQGRSSADTTIREVMTAPVITVDTHLNIDKCMSIMTERHLRHLPVVENGELLGLLSIGDLVKAAIAEQADLIQQLEQYIRGE